jgi:tetratricopeptide (TPR) repeat protein
LAWDDCLDRRNQARSFRRANDDYQGCRMLSAKLLRLASVGVCSAVMTTGCGTRETPIYSGPDRLPAPRKIELPGNIRPLLRAEPSDLRPIDQHSVPAQYQQPQGSGAAGARIVELAQREQRVEQAIREPQGGSWQPSSSPVAQSPPARSEFVPIEMPPASAAPIPAAIPPLSSEQSTAVARTAAAGPDLYSANQNQAVAVAPAANAPSIEGPARASSTFMPVAPPIFSGANAGFHATPAPQPTVPVEQTDGVRAASQRSIQMANQAASMVQRGMLFCAKSELIKALTLLTQALDIQESTTTHSAALSAGMMALQEAREFVSADGREPVKVATIASTHRTQLPTRLPTDISPLVAQQHYLAYAQTELTFAASSLPAAAEILYRLGRVQTAIAMHDTDTASLNWPQTIVFHQAALATDPNHWLASNELGVIYARYGRLPEAKQLLVKSVSVHPSREGWQNLSVIHRRLGENDLAQRADAERQLLEGKSGAGNTASDMIRWVDPKAFAASGGEDVSWPAKVAANPAASSGTTKR